MFFYLFFQLFKVCIVLNGNYNTFINMDGISHLLVGRIIATAQKLSPQQNFMVAFFGYLPDLSQLILYPLLVWILPRPYYFPSNEDWIGITDKHTWFTFAYEFPHSLLFVMLFLVPFVWYMGLPKLCIASYISHILLDIPTHTGEWSTKFLLPSYYYYIEGITDAWAWNYSSFVMTWILLSAILGMILYMKGELFDKI